MAGSRDHLLTLPCRYGAITFPRADEVVGASLQIYGEWAQAEIELLLELTPFGGTVIDAGAFIGTHTLALAGKVGPEGRVFAIEAQPAIRDLLVENVEQNDVRSVQIVDAAIDCRPGVLRFPKLDLTAAGNFAGSRALASQPNTALAESIEVESTTLDDVASERVDLIKADLEGMEVQALEGGRRILSEDRPHLYLECSSVSNGLRILEFLRAQDYRIFMHRALAFNPNNYFGSEKRLFGLARETNLLGVAEERVGEVRSLLERSVELVQVDGLDSLAFLYLTTARWGEPEWSTLSKPGLIARLTGLLQDQERLEEQVRKARHAQQSAEEDAARTREDLSAAAEDAARTREELAAAAQDAARRREELVAAAENAARTREELAAAAKQSADETARLEQELDRLRSQRAEEADKARRALDDSERRRAEEAERAAAQIETLRLQLAAATVDHTAAVSSEPSGSGISVEEGSAPEGALRGIEGAPGWAAAIVERLRDSPLFDPTYYLEHNRDIAHGDIDPLVHYVLEGAGENRDPHPLFNTSYYLAQAPHAAGGEVNPLHHFITGGFRQGLDPHPLFLTRFYLDQAPECRRNGVDPLTHYVTGGGRRGVDPHPLFDSYFYVVRHPELEASEVSPLAHFLLRGASDGSDPHPLFSCADYLGMHPELPGIRINPLLHFVTEGRCAGYLPHRPFDLANDKHVVTELDRLRHDGRRVVLFVSSEADAVVESSLREIEAVIRHRCVTLRLRPADPQIFGETARGLFTLTAMCSGARGLQFDPRHQLDKLVTVLRGVGVTRVHVHQATGHSAQVRDLLAALALPIDLSPSEDELAGGLRDHRGRERSAQRGGLRGKLKRRFRSFAGGIGRGDVEAWLVAAADRIIVPSAHAARSFSRRWPHTSPIVAPPTDATGSEPIDVAPARLRAEHPLRVAVVWEANQRDETGVVESCAERAHARELPLELVAVGSWPFRSRTSESTGVAVRPEDALTELLWQLSPDVVWFPTRRPPSYSRRLHQALRAGLPTVVAAVGSYPEQVAGRPWTWVVAGDATAAEWCRTLAEVRERLLSAVPPPPQLPREDHGRFYPEVYLAAQGLR